MVCFIVAFFLLLKTSVNLFSGGSALYIETCLRKSLSSPDLSRSNSIDSGISDTASSCSSSVNTAVVDGSVEVLYHCLVK